MHSLGEGNLGRAFDALFEPGAANDLVAIAEARVSSGLAVLVPQLGDALVELVELRGEGCVMSVRQTVQESGAVLAGALDLGTDVFNRFHTDKNETGRSSIPFAAARYP